MRNLLLKFLLIFLISIQAYGQNAPTTASYSKIQGYAMQGGQAVTVSSIVTSTKFQVSYPNCTVTVFDVGTSNISTIYADSNGTPKANPFTASNTGYWFFYAPTGLLYDVQFSGTGISSPFTLGGFVAPSTGNSGGFSRITLNSTPVFDLATNTLATDMIVSHSSVTIGANKTFSAIRLSNTDGSDNSYVVGASSTISNIGNFIKALAGSDATSNVYGMVIQADNAGAGTVKALHILSQGVAGSTGVLTGLSLDVKPVTGQGATFDLQIASSGINNVARGIIFTSNGGNFDYGIDFLGFASSPTYNSAAIRLPNNTYISARNAANTTDVPLIRLTSSDQVEVGNNLINQSSNAFFQVGSGSSGWLFQRLDSDGTLRFFRQSVGSTFHLNNDGSILLELPVAFANLGTPTNGTVVFCSNCNAASSPCTSGGTGAFAFRQGGAWKCL